MEENHKSANNAENVIGWLERLSNLIKKSGIQNIFVTIMVLFLVIIAGEFAFYPEKLINRLEMLKQHAHSESIMKRMESSPKIRETIYHIRKELNADRVFILETHNGGSNLANLPFIYVDLSYAEPVADMAWLESEYTNVRLSRYPFATKMFEDSYWAGTMEEMETIDPELHYNLTNDGVGFLACQILYGNHSPSGVVGVVYKDPEKRPSNETIKKTLIKYRKQLSEYLCND